MKKEFSDFLSYVDGREDVEFFKRVRDAIIDYESLNSLPSNKAVTNSFADSWPTIVEQCLHHWYDIGEDLVSITKACSRCGYWKQVPKIGTLTFPANGW